MIPKLGTVFMPTVSRDEFLRARSLKRQAEEGSSSSSSRLEWASLEGLWQSVFELVPFCELPGLARVCKRFYQLVWAMHRSRALSCSSSSSCGLSWRRPASIFELPAKELESLAVYHDQTRGSAAAGARSQGSARLPLVCESGLLVEVCRLSGVRLDRGQPLLSLRGLLGRCVLLLNQGGYMAIARYEGQRCVQHTSVHRYLVRKKAGGRQITRDKAGSGHRKSIGAQIRRDQEKHFREAVRQRLLDWGSLGLIEAAVPLFIAAPGPINREYLFFEGSPLHQVELVHNVPFSTNKPCFTEIEKCHAHLTQVKFLKPFE
ncbi:MAG: hypothetical protein Q8P67_09355 [archaeon]|nr:hypothetical protein [archaeon]